MSDVPDAQQVATREFIANGLLTEARGFYAQITTVASAFLGGSVLFRHKLPDVPSFNWLLGVAWTCFALSLTLVVIVRLNNISGAERALDAIDGRQTKSALSGSLLLGLGRGCTLAAVALLALGVFALVAFGWASLYA